MTDEADARCVLAAERALYDAMIARDFAALERLLAPDLVYVHSTAVAETRQAYLAGVARGLYEYESIRTHDAQIQLYGTVALIRGICAMRVGEAGRPRNDIRLLFVLVWRRDDDGWRLLHRHATRIPAE